MDKLHFKHIAAYQQDVSKLPVISQDISINVYRKKAYARTGYTYQVGNKEYGYTSGLSFDKMILELREVISWYKDNTWINADDTARIIPKIRIIKHYD